MRKYGKSMFEILSDMKEAKPEIEIDEKFSSIEPKVIDRIEKISNKSSTKKPRGY